MKLRRMKKHYLILSVIQTKKKYENSKLTNKIVRLTQLDNRYQLIEYGTFSNKESILIKGFRRLIKNLNNQIKSEDYSILEDFENSIIEKNYSFIKGEKEISKNLFARARIEEYIFSSKKCANLFINNLNEILTDQKLWQEIDKSPNSIHLEGSRVYFIISGGWYMKPFYKEIVNEFKIKDESSNNCSTNEFLFVKNRVENYPNLVGIKDAEILLRNAVNICKTNLEYSRLHNDMLFNICLLNPKSILELLKDENYKLITKQLLLAELGNPQSENISFNLILEKINNLEDNVWKEKMEKSLQLAISKKKAG